VVVGFPEYGRLRRVLMHAPGHEIDRIGPESYRRFLFEDAVEASSFRGQHDQLVATLRTEGVDVVLVERLLHGSRLLDLAGRSPNLVYMRDTVAVTPAGSIRMSMKSPVRRHEPRIAAAALDQLGIRRLMAVKPPATMEGGDLIFLDGETLLVGVGNRTNPIALRQLRERTRAHGLRVLIAIRLPWWAIHLDGTMMIVDQDLAIVHRESLKGEAIVHEEGKRPKRTRLMKVLRQRGFRFVEVTAYERQRRATNVITLGPRKVLGYSGNARVRKLLTDEGVDVVDTEGSELVRGGGGPRCLTAPIERETRPSRNQATSSRDGVG
jgi:arginine deiminase